MAQRKVPTSEDLLSRVKPADIPIVQSVCAALAAVQYPDHIVKGFVVNPLPGGTHYEVDAFLSVPSDGDWRVTFDDLHTIRSVSPARVQNVAVRRTNRAISICVLVASEDTAVMQSELEVVFVHKTKRSWASVFGARDAKPATKQQRPLTPPE